MTVEWPVSVPGMVLIPSAAYSLIRSATSSWLPTNAVPAPPRTSPIPAPHGLDTRRILRHPGTGHGAGRRTGSTPVASNAGP